MKRLDNNTWLKIKQCWAIHRNVKYVANKYNISPYIIYYRKNKEKWKYPVWNKTFCDCKSYYDSQSTCLVENHIRYNFNGCWQYICITCNGMRCSDSLIMFAHRIKNKIIYRWPFDGFTEIELQDA